MEIRLDSLSKTYEESSRGTLALKSVSTRIESGEFFFLLGPSGCGKTTLLRLIAGLLRPTAGRIYFDGKDVTELPVNRRNTALVFQGYALWPHMTVTANVEFGPRMKGLPGPKRRQMAADQLRRVQMENYADRKPNQLSGGQQQRVAVARALAAESGCLLLDEPLSNLDARLRLHMREELRELVKRSGVTAVYVTHDQKEALSMADRIAVMNAGEIVQCGTPEELYNRPTSRFVADFLGEANFIDGQLVAAGSPARLQTAHGEIRCGDDRGLTAGQSLTCCVRPERITIQTADSQPDASDNGIEATVAANMYLGEIRQFACHLDADPETVWRVSMLAHEAPAVQTGDRVQLRFAVDHAVLLAQ